MSFLTRCFLGLLDILVYAVVRTVFALTRVLPERVSLALMRVCIRALLLIMPRSRKVGARNLELIFPEKSAAEREKILTASYETLARHLLAFSQIPDLTLESAKEMFDYTEIRPIWDRARATAPEGTGCLIVTAHYGSFELLVQAHALLDRPLAVLTRPFALPRLENWWKNQRERFGNVQFSRGGGYQQVMSYLRAGTDVLLVMDQNVKLNHAVFVDFFGIPAATTKVAAVAAIRTGAPVFFAACAEIAPKRYKMLYAPIGRADDFPGTVDEKVHAMTAAIHREFERAIRAHPEQWMWIHRRYKTRPAGEAENIYSGKELAAW